MVNARLPSGARLNAVMAPLALRGPYVTIRKFREQPFTLNELVERKSLSAQAARFLVACIRGRRNIVVSGNTGSGKTTLLNVLCQNIAPYERVVTIEDPAELRINLPDVNSLEPKPANQEGKGGATMRDLVANALRMRPDRIIVGEVRDGAALDMLQAMNTGHDGSLTTVHANSARHVVSRLETLALHADVDLPSRAIRQQIADAIHLIVHQQRIVGHPIKRKVVSITAVTGMTDDSVELQEMYRLKQDTSADEPALVYTGARPAWLRELELAGIELPF
jgi:pilus assembly protein CpaF